MTLNNIKIMKHIKIPVFSLLCIVLVSCSDFLDIAPTSTYTNENLFQTTDQAVTSLMGVYNSLLYDGLYGRNIVMYYDLDTDLSQIAGGNSYGKPDGERRSIAHYAFDASTSQLSNAWQFFYDGIERANIVIDKVPKMDLYTNGTDEQKKILQRVLGESLTLRAILYFDLVRFWGDVPFKTTPSYAGQNFDIPRTSRDTIYDHIIGDLTKSIELVPWADEVTFDERITKGAVKGILARVSLYAAGYSLRWDLETGDLSTMKMDTRQDQSRIRELYQIARDQTNDIIVKGIHKLNPNYETIWKNICTYKIDNQYMENIFEIGFYSRLQVRHEAGSFGAYMGPRSAVESKWGKCDGGVWALPSFYLKFDPEDTRRDVSISYLQFKNTTPEYKMNKGQPTDLSAITPAKWRMQWAPQYIPYYTNFNYPLLRFSDVLLMFAEADSWLAGQATPDAIEALKQVRRRAFPTKTATIDAEVYPTDFNGFLNTIIDERAFELAFEGFRKTDLIRWNKLASTIDATKNEIAALNACYTPGNSQTPLNPYDGSIERLKGTILPRVVYNRDNGGTFVEVTFTKPESTVGWTSSNWLNTTFADGMGQFAIGFVPNRSELYPIPTTIRNVSPSLSQLPTY